MSDPIIRVENLRTGFGDLVLHGSVSFEVQRGEVFAILGGSGSGKTVLLKTMIGLYAPLAGRALIAGKDIVQATDEERLEILKRIGVMYQLGALFGSMTLAENIRLPLEEYTELPDDAMDLVARMKLELVQLHGTENMIPAEISGGMMKRAAIARAMALDPDIVFLDEPSGGLDPITSAELDQLILRLRDSLGITFVVITHELPSIFTIADRCIMLDKEAKGIIAEGRPAELRDHSPNPRVRQFFNRRAEPEEVAA
jgi:phospholipid/cholesterol/gamma-HCH transport system ATP-binding protein